MQEIIGINKSRGLQTALHRKDRLYLYRRMFGIARELFEDNAEDLLRYFIALNMGKRHFSDLSDDDIINIEIWMESLGYGE